MSDLCFAGMAGCVPPNVRQTCAQGNLVYSRPMTKLLLLLLLVTGLVAGCASEPSGSREFIPGQGWVPTE